MHRAHPVWGVLLTALIAVSCSTAGAVGTAEEAPTSRVDPTPTPEAVAPTTTAIAASPINSTTTTLAATSTTVSPYARPSWLGQRPLKLRPDGFGQVGPTPPELMDRRLATPDLLPRPKTNAFESTLGAVPDDVVARSSWSEDCPVALDELAYITMSHVGFDGETHTGEMLVNAAVAEAVVAVFAELFAEGFPIEEMRVMTADEIDAPPTGDGNLTSSFECRPATQSSRWSQHAYGLAIDINPFHNPYIRGDLVLPELASFYLDRSLDLPGMIETSRAVELFDSIGWQWGGNWSSLKDWMHFSRSGT